MVCETVSGIWMFGCTVGTGFDLLKKKKTIYQRFLPFLSLPCMVVSFRYSHRMMPSHKNLNKSLLAIPDIFQFSQAGHAEYVNCKAAFVFFLNLSSMDDFYPPTGLSFTSCPVASFYILCQRSFPSTSEQCYYQRDCIYATLSELS